MANIEKFTDHTIENEHTIHFAENEILLSFNSDSGAAAFSEWWCTEGSKQFREFVERNITDLEEFYG